MNGRYFIIYTTEVGGLLQVRASSREEFDEIKRKGYMSQDSFYDVPTTVEPKMIALLRVEDNHDFILGGSRDEAAK